MVIEEKQKRNKKNEGASKKMVPSREETLKDEPSTLKEKDKAPTNKLQLDIEIEKKMMKVLEECI